jgi:hypothetical protein
VAGAAGASCNYGGFDANPRVNCRDYTHHSQFARITCSCSNMFAGGELFDIVNSDEQHAQLSESLLGGNLSAQSSGCTCASWSVVTSNPRVRLPPSGEKQNLITSGTMHRHPPDGKPLVKLTISTSYAKSTPTTHGSPRAAVPSPTQHPSYS